MITVSHLTKIYQSYSFLDRVKYLIGFKLKNNNTKPALDDISLTINKGEMLGLIGPNGAGKSTLMKIMTGILKPTSGQVKLESHIPFDLELDFKLQITLFRGESKNLDDGITVSDSLHEKLNLYHQQPLVQNVYARELIELTNTQQFLDINPDNLSLGQRMLTELVYALITKPQYVFFDEPSLGLDLNAILIFRKLVKKLNKKYGMTFIITSHDLANVVDICPRIVLINHGRIMVDQAVSQLLSKDTNDKQIKFLLTQKPDLIRLPKNINYDYPYLTVNTNKHELKKEIIYWTEKLEFADITIGEPSLETIFSRFYAA